MAMMATAAVLLARQQQMQDLIHAFLSSVPVAQHGGRPHRSPP